jgi:thiamine pyrophosphokinase
MQDRALKFDEPVTLVGGGPLDRAMLAEARAAAPVTIAADRAADLLTAWGVEPAAVIGDMDSIARPEAWEQGKVPFLHLREQDSTDFEKCLYSVDAPWFVAAGFTGGRIDHTLAVFHAMLRHPGKPVFLLGEVEAITMLPPRRTVALALEPRARLSVFPLVPVRGLSSEGLEWPINGLDLAPGAQIGTSNRTVSARVSVSVDGPGALLILPRRFLRALIDGVLSGMGR